MIGKSLEAAAPCCALFSTPVGSLPVGTWFLSSSYSATPWMRTERPGNCEALGPLQRHEWLCARRTVVPSWLASGLALPVVFWLLPAFCYIIAFNRVCWEAQGTDARRSLVGKNHYASMQLCAHASMDIALCEHATMRPCEHTTMQRLVTKRR